jgi:CRP/FNR family transcriptional regulator, cyclic AMP receptor protein
MARKPKKRAFDPKLFLSTVSGMKRGRTEMEYRKGQTIYSQGGPADAVYYLQKGKVKIVATSEQGKEAVVAILGAGEFFGEGCLIGQPLRLAAAVSMADADVMKVKKSKHDGSAA